jgi:hypothetical protein
MEGAAGHSRRASRAGGGSVTSEPTLEDARRHFIDDVLLPALTQAEQIERTPEKRFVVAFSRLVDPNHTFVEYRFASTWDEAKQVADQAFSEEGPIEEQGWCMFLMADRDSATVNLWKLGLGVQFWVKDDAGWSRRATYD